MVTYLNLYIFFSFKINTTTTKSWKWTKSVHLNGEHIHMHVHIKKWNYFFFSEFSPSANCHPSTNLFFVFQPFPRNPIQTTSSQVAPTAVAAPPTPPFVAKEDEDEGNGDGDGDDYDDGTTLFASPLRQLFKHSTIRSFINSLPFLLLIVLRTFSIFLILWKWLLKKFFH